MTLECHRYERFKEKAPKQLHPRLYLTDPEALPRARRYEVGPARFPVTEVADGIDEKCIAMLDHYGIAHK